MSQKSQKRAKKEFSTAGEFNAWVNENLEGENKDVFAHAGLIDNPQALELMNHLELSYSPQHPDMPVDFQKTDAAMAIRQSEGTKVASKAVNEGNISQMKYFTGKQDYSSEANSIHTLIKLREKIGQDAYIAYLFGHMGNGKTDFANLIGELAKRELGYEVASNQKSPYENGNTDAYVWTYGDIIQWLTKDIDTDIEINTLQDLSKIDKEIEPVNKLVIFDEASQEASGYSSDAHDAQEKLGKLLKLIRKVGGRLIIIGHTGKDVHPDIRRLSNDCIHKVSKKTAEFYASVEEAKGVDLKDTISKIPETNWDYQTTEVCVWDWSNLTGDKLLEQGNDIADYQSTEERNLTMAKAYVTNQHKEIEPDENGNITQEMLAEYYDLTTGRVSQIFKEMKDESEEMGTIA